MGGWNGCGYGLVCFSQNSEPEIWQKSLCLRNFAETFLYILASEKYSLHSGKLPFQTPPLQTPTKCGKSFSPPLLARFSPDLILDGFFFTKLHTHTNAPRQKQL